LSGLPPHAEPKLTITSTSHHSLSHARARAYARPSGSLFFLSFSWTLITSTFSHAQPGHAFLNGLTFWFLAPTALLVLGNAQFLALYLGSASPVFSSFSSPLKNLPLRRRVRERRIAGVEQRT
jgi:membrane associated rhomboid family serine protease